MWVVSVSDVPDGDRPAASAGAASSRAGSRVVGEDSNPLLSLEGLNVTFASPDGDVHAVRDLSLTVAHGECLGVVGESGAGKSQAFLAAMGLLPANGRASGRALLGTVDLLTLRQRELDRIRGARIGMVFQDPMTSLTPHIRIGDQIAEPIIRHTGVSSSEAKTRALSLLNQVHVSDAGRRMRQYPHELSGGMRQRVMIAIALSCDPELLITDEPTTALDVTIQAQILALLAELKHSRGMSMVLVTHDMGAVAGVADRVAVMRSGAVVEVGLVGTVFKAPQHPYTRELLAAVSSVGAGSASRPGGGAGISGAASAAPALVLNDIHVQFKFRTTLFGKQQTLRAVDAVSLELAPGEALGVVGESGSGKSTLARAALQLIRAQSGRVVWFGRQVDALAQSALRPLRRDVQVVFQDPLASLDPRMTVGNIVAEPLRVHRPDLERAGADAAVVRALELVRLDPALASRYPHELSGGQCQRVGIARAMVTQPQLLICDEPISALDVTIQEQIVNLLAELGREAGVAILFISHNLAVVRKLCDRILVLYLGRMMELAPASSIYSRQLHPYTRELLASAPIPDPDVQPARLKRAVLGEPPSPLSSPSGCVYRSRCPHAIAVCAERVPAWEEDGGRWVACHRWRDLAP
jgi:oligopeptide/dipeptide ABC transporter ATP-binding protein